MLKKILFFLLYLIPLIHFSQDYSDLWEGHYSYYNINGVVKGNDKIYAFSDNAIFSLDIRTNEIKELSTINGLSGKTISTIYYSEVYELLIIGYETGLIEIVFDDDILTIINIVDTTVIPGTDKRINHISDRDELIYISTDYGISVYNLERLEFGDTYFIGDGGTQIQVKQTTIFNNFIYAACQDGGGIRKASLSNQNLIDFQNWQTISNDDYIAIENNQDNLYAVNSDNKIFSITDDNLSELYLYDENVKALTASGGDLIVTTVQNVFVYDANFNLNYKASTTSGFSTSFSSSITDSGYLYIGTNGLGLSRTSILDLNNYETFHPDNPLLNIPSSLQVDRNGVLWVTYGDYKTEYNPYLVFNNHGVSRLIAGKWENTLYSEVLGAKCLKGITINPNQNNQVFISSFLSGLLELNNGVPTVLYNESNSGLDDLIDPTAPDYKGDIRVGETTFDNQGVLWTITSRVDKPLKSYNPDAEINKWNSYDFSSIIPNSFKDNLGFSEIVIDPVTNTKFIASYDKGVIGFNENNGNEQLKFISTSNNLPVRHVRSLALDRNNQLWIGTHNGLRVLYSTSDFFTNSSLIAEQIIILEEGVAKALLSDQFISDIKVDGSNNKWIGTFGSGVFYLSSDGQKTISHFTIENSPLPSNNINDISLDRTNGIVYIATDRGLVSFKAGVTNPTENLKNAYVFPNPIRPNFDIVKDKVKIRGFSENVNIKITDVEGNLVAEAQSKTNDRTSGYNLEIDGGTAFWNGKNLSNNIVASGVYLVMISDIDTFETTTLKFLVIR